MSLTRLKNNNPISRLKSNILNVSLKDLLYEVLVQNTDLIEDLNAEQLNQGIRSDGSRIEPEYSPGYAELKKSLGFNPNIVNLKLDGDYQRGITAKVSKYVVDIDNIDSKDAKLSEKYGATIIGLTEDSVAMLNREITPLLIEKLKKRLLA